MGWFASFKPSHGSSAALRESRACGRKVGGEWIRYRDPEAYGKNDADEFLDYVNGPDGVVPWLEKQM